MASELPQVPPVTLGRSGVRSTKLALGSANWIGRVGDDAYVELLREALSPGYPPRGFRAFLRAGVAG